jgi:hypothetical protein
MNILELLDAYESRFGCTSELIPISLWMEPKLGQMLQRALDTGRAITAEDLDSQFGPLEWEECKD